MPSFRHENILPAKVGMCATYHQNLHDKWYYHMRGKCCFNKKRCKLSEAEQQHHIDSAQSAILVPCDSCPKLFCGGMA